MNSGALRICLVGPLPPPSGGMANQTMQLAELLRGEGLPVQVVQVNAPYRPDWVRHLRGIRAAFRAVPYCTALWRAIADSDVVHVMANSGWSWHLFAAPAVWIAWMQAKPAIVNYRGGEAPAFFARSIAAVRPTLARAAAIAVPTEFLAGVFRRQGIEAVIVPNVVDMARFSPASGEPRRARPHLIVTRNLEPIYDVATAIRALALLRQKSIDAHLTIAGTGPELGALRRLAAELGLGELVHFAGRVESHDMARLYQSADLMLNPSTVDNAPNSILEAWSAGVPVVSSNVGGIPFLVRDGVDALLVPAGDPAAMASAAMRLLTSSTPAAALANAGRAAVQRFAWSSVRPQWLDLYRRVASAPTRSARSSAVGH